MKLTIVWMVVWSAFLVESGRLVQFYHVSMPVKVLIIIILGVSYSLGLRFVEWCQYRLFVRRVGRIVDEFVEQVVEEMHKRRLEEFKYVNPNE